jgi:hypothetical protein
MIGRPSVRSTQRRARRIIESASFNPPSSTSHHYSPTDVTLAVELRYSSSRFAEHVCGIGSTAEWVTIHPS